MTRTKQHSKQLTLDDVATLDRDEGRCTAETVNGERCSNDAVIGLDRCHTHIPRGGSDETDDAPVWERHREQRLASDG